MSDTRYPPNPANNPTPNPTPGGTPIGTGRAADPASEAPRFAPQEGIGPNVTTREGAVQPRVTDRHAPMPERPMSTEAARQGYTLGHIRWVLLISTVLAVVAMALAWLLI